MPFPPVAQTVQVEVRAVIADQHVENRIMVNVGDTVTDLLMTSVGGIFVTWVETPYAGICSTNVLFTEVVVRDISVADGAEISIPVNTNGVQDSAPYPNETSFVISLRTGLTGRSRRGRIYLFPPVTGFIIPPNHVTSAYRDLAIALMQTLLDNLDAAGFAAGVVSYISGGVQRVTPLFTRYTAAIAVDDLLDSARSRKPGNGS